MNQSTYQLPTQPMSMGAIFSDSLKIYKAAFFQVLFWVILAAIISSAGNALAGSMSSTNPMSTAFLGSIISIVANLLSIIPAAAGIYTLYQAMQQQQLSLSSEIQRGFASFFKLIGAYILFFLVTMAIYLIPIILAVVLKVISASQTNHMSAWAAVIVGILFFLAFLAFAYVAVSVFSFGLLIITERQGVFEAFKNSFKIIKGHWWRTFWLLVLTMIIVIALNIIVMDIIALIFGLQLLTAAAFTAMAHHSNAVDVHIHMLIWPFVSAIFIPWVYGVLLLQVRNLQLRQQSQM